MAVSTRSFPNGTFEASHGLDQSPRQHHRPARPADRRREGKCARRAAGRHYEVMLPASNERDLEDIPTAVRAQLKFVWSKQVDDAIKVAVPALPLSAEV